ncbi:hypothetical protein LguiB_025776 [Lonicera macranthoides]
MESTNQETPSEVTDQLEKPSGDSSGMGRSYECTFCKRGFTNAQALGGHMNIHRKEKAKAKQHSQHPKSIEDFHMSTSRYFAPITSDIHQPRQQDYHPNTFGPQLNYQFYLPSPNPSFPQGQSIQRFESISANEEHLGANLSLQIGSSSAGGGAKGGNGDGREDLEENEVDLELRLGLDP